MTSLAFVPRLTSQAKNKIWADILAILLGVFLISFLAQVTLPLPWTPVPITGQTFAVTLVSLLWGRKRGFGVLLSYLSIGALGFPVFAMGKSGFVLGPTFGYLIGMLVASFVVGSFSDRGITKSFFKSLGAAYLGSILVLGFGAMGLSFYMPWESVLMAGVLPFLPGDTIKNLMAVSLVTGISSKSFKR